MVNLQMNPTLIYENYVVHQEKTKIQLGYLLY